MMIDNNSYHVTDNAFSYRWTDTDRVILNEKTMKCQDNLNRLIDKCEEVCDHLDLNNIDPEFIEFLSGLEPYMIKNYICGSNEEVQEDSGEPGNSNFSSYHKRILIMNETIHLLRHLKPTPLKVKSSTVKRRVIVNNRNIEDIIHAIPMEYMYDDDLLIFKGLEGNVRVNHHNPALRKRKVVLITVDTSGSMGSFNGIEKAYGVIYKELQDYRSGDIIMICPYSSDIRSLTILKNIDDVAKFRHRLMHFDIENGGGTDFTGSVLSAVDLIKKDYPTYSIYSLITVTDTEDHIQPDRICHLNKCINSSFLICVKGNVEINDQFIVDYKSAFPGTVVFKV